MTRSARRVADPPTAPQNAGRWPDRAEEGTKRLGRRPGNIAVWKRRAGPMRRRSLVSSTSRFRQAGRRGVRVRRRVRPGASGQADVQGAMGAARRGTRGERVAVGRLPARSTGGARIGGEAWTAPRRRLSQGPPRCARRCIAVVFSGGPLRPEQTAEIRLRANELSEWRFVSVDELDRYVIPVMARRLRALLAGGDAVGYLEEGATPGER